MGEAVRVHAADYFCVVFENNSDGVAHFDTDEGAQNPEVFPFREAWLQRAEGFVGIFSVNGFAQRTRPGAAFQFRSWRAGQILPAWSVAPHHFIGSNVVNVGSWSGYIFRTTLSDCRQKH
jgi:hypothetical protein